MATRLTKQTYTYVADSEAEADELVAGYKNRQFDEGYTVVNSKIDYKFKKDKKTGAVIEEVWNTNVTVSYEV